MDNLGRCYLKGRKGDAAKVMLSAVDYATRLVLASLKVILRLIRILCGAPLSSSPRLNGLLNGRRDT